MSYAIDATDIDQGQGEVSKPNAYLTEAKSWLSICVASEASILKFTKAKVDMKGLNNKFLFWEKSLPEKCKMASFGREKHYPRHDKGLFLCWSSIVAIAI